MVVRAAARTALVAGMVATAVWGGAGAAGATGSGAHPTWRANALFAAPAGDAVVDVTVAEPAGAPAAVRADLFLPGWACTVDGQPRAADVSRLDSARVVATLGYTCSEDGGGGQGLAPGTLTGSVQLDVTWAGTGTAVAQPLFDGVVGRYVVREAEVSGVVSVTGDVSTRLEANSAHLAREATVLPPGRLR